MANFSIIGAGLTGATIARELADAGHDVAVFEKRGWGEFGGLCADRVTPRATPVAVFGPHIFHTDDDDTFKFVKRFATMRPYVHTVQNLTDVGMVDWPINMNTIEAVYGSFAEFEAALAEAAIRFEGCEETFESKAQKMVGRKLYELTIEGYTEKQWGTDANDVSVELLGRIPIKSTFDNTFFSDKHVALPEDGYTEMIKRMLACKNIKLMVSTDMRMPQLLKLQSEGHTIINTADPRELYGRAVEHDEKYRFLAFYHIWSDQGARLAAPVVNYGTTSVPFTRTTDYGMLYGTDEKQMIAEYSVKDTFHDGVKAYPVRTKKCIEAMEAVIAEVESAGIICAGRLGKFKYLDMDDAIMEARALVRERGWVA